jgi:glutathione S-transferase
MKLYYNPGACSLSPHIVLCEAGYKYDAEKVDLKTRKDRIWEKIFQSITDKGAVPLLVLDNGEQC